MALLSSLTFTDSPLSSDHADLSSTPLASSLESSAIASSSASAPLPPPLPPPPSSASSTTDVAAIRSDLALFPSLVCSQQQLQNSITELADSYRQQNRSQPERVMSLKTTVSTAIRPAMADNQRHVTTNKFSLLNPSTSTPCMSAPTR
jgi:hypothetical protein